MEQVVVMLHYPEDLEEGLEAVPLVQEQQVKEIVEHKLVVL